MSVARAASAVAGAVMTWRFVLALVVAVALWVRLTIAQNPEREDAYPTDIPVEVRGLAPSLVVANDLGMIRVRIAAPEASWRRLQASNFRATVDLALLPAGFHQRDIVVECSDPDVRLQGAVPAKAAVRVEEVRTTEVPVRANLTGSVPFGFRVVGAPVVHPAVVSLSGPASAVEKVTDANVTVRMDEVRSTVERTIKPEARGAAGAVAGVRVEPQSVSVTVEVEQIAGSKAVPLIATVRGQPAQGFWLAGVSVDPPTVQVVGDPAQLEKLTSLATQDVDLTAAGGDFSRSVAIVRPAGVSIVGEVPATVRVRVAALPGQQLRSTVVVPADLMPGHYATVFPEVVSVLVSGPQPVLLRLGAGDLVAHVDLTALGPGTLALPVSVVGPDGVRIERVEPELVSVVIGLQITSPASPSTN